MPSFKENLKSYLIPEYFLDYYRRAKDVASYYQQRKNFGVEKQIVDLIRSFFKPKLKVFFYPTRPSGIFVEFKLCAYLGVTITDRLTSKPDVVFRREAKTQIDSNLKLSRQFTRIINNNNIDISKKNVQEKMELIFGYPLAIDPYISRKSNSKVKSKLHARWRDNKLSNR